MVWQDRAACLGYPVDFFFTAKAKAKAICSDCPVTAKCLELALSNEHPDTPRYGVFGGKTADERRRLGESTPLCVIDGCDRRRDSSIGMCTAHKYRADHGIPLDKPFKKKESA